MDDVYDRAFEEVMGFLESGGYGRSARGVHRLALTDYHAYLRARGVPASRESARDWADGVAADPVGRPKGYAAAAARVADAVCGEAITPRLGNGGARAASRLAPWSGRVLEEYVADALEGRVGPKHAAQEAARAADFLAFLEGRGVSSPREIGIGDVVAYQRRDDPAVGPLTSRLRVYAAKSLLTWLASRGVAPLSAAMMMDGLYTRHMPLFGPLPGDWGEGLPAAQFKRLADGYVAGCLEARGYGGNVIKVARKCLGMLFVFLDANGLGYTPEVAEAWASRLTGPGGVGSSAKMYSRTLRSFEDFRLGGDGAPGRPAPCQARDPLGGLPAWSRLLVAEYLGLLRREGMAGSTVDCARSAVGRFASYLDSRGVRGWEGVTPELAAGFPLADAGHATAAGRQLYARKAAAFLAWLGELGVVPGTLFLAVPTAAARRSGVVEVLSDAELSAVAAFRAGASTPAELRDAAMVSLGLREGLRASDVAGLSLADVDWRASRLAVVQRKTLSRVELPLAPEAGNDLMRYVLDGRPESTLPNAFLLHRAPYGPVGRGACERALARVLAASGLPPRGFHALRRTFATGVLSGGAGRHLVAEALGHRGDSSVDAYLALDAGGMRACALPLSALEGVGVDA